MEIRSKLLDAAASGTLIPLLASINADDELEDVSEQLADLHMSGDLQLAKLIEGGASGELPYHSSYKVERVLARALRKMNGPVAALIELVEACLKAMGGPIQEGILPSFETWLIERPDEAVKALSFFAKEGTTNEAIVLRILNAALKLSAGQHLDAVLSLVEEGELSRASTALRAVAGVAEALSHGQARKVVAVAQARVAKDNEDQIASEAVRLIVALATHRKVAARLYHPCIDAALLTEGKPVLVACTDALAWETTRLPKSLHDRLIARIVRLKPAEAAVLNRVDWAMAQLLKNGYEADAVLVAEALMLRDDITVDIANFDSFTRHLLGDHPGLVSKLALRWFRKGHHVLGRAIRVLVGMSYGDPLELQFDAEELTLLSDRERIFICGKAVGHLFFHPVTAASLLVSALAGTRKPARDEIEELLFYPLMISNPNSVGGFLKRAKRGAMRSVQNTIRSVLRRHDEYLDDLRAVGEVHEFQPSGQERGIVADMDRDDMERAHRDAENQSVLADIVHKEMLLYGNGWVSYDKSPSGDWVRHVGSLQMHSVSIEAPRLGAVDAAGLQYLLTSLKSERLP